MWFRKAKPVAPAPGPGALDGHSAALAVASMACETVLVRADSAFIELTGPLRHLVPGLENPDAPAEVRAVADLRRLAAMLVGQSAAGLRTAGFVDELDGIHAALRAAAGKRLPFVINLTGRAGRRQAGSLHGGHDDYFSAADTGLFQLFARNVQEVVDFGLIAHRVAELALTPGLCAQDFYRTSQSVQNVHLPARDAVLRYLGGADDSIEVPTPAQRVLFGEHRRRIPRLIDLDHPAGVGGVQDQESFFRAVAAQRVFFTGHLGEIMGRAMREFGALTGRHYAPVVEYRVEDADVVVLAQGAIVDELQAVADYLRAAKIMRAGVLNLALLRPFPAAELARCLQGKRAVAVVERTDNPLAEDGPLLQATRSAIDRALENGRADSRGLPYPGYPSYRGLAERPELFGGVYGVGAEIPSFDALLAVFTNLQPGAAGRRHFYVGTELGRASRRFPQLQSLQQRLNKDYPQLPELSLARPAMAAARPRCTTLRLCSLSMQGGLFAGNLFARLLAGALGQAVRTLPGGGLEGHLVPSALTLLHGEGDLRSEPVTADAILVTGAALFEALAAGAPVEAGGTLIVASNAAPEAFWAGISRRSERWIREHALRLFVLDARRIAAEAGSPASFVDQLSIWALLGAYLQTLGGEAPERAECEAALGTLLRPLFRERDPLVGAITTAFRRGREELVALPWESWPPQARGPDLEPAAPWTVERAEPDAVPLFDGTRFWHSVGYLYGRGEADQALTDPFLATGLLPAGTSARRDMSACRLRMPQWLPENCTGCGQCWAQCPDTALPPTAQSLENLIETAMSDCKREGAGMVQMARIAGHLAKQAHRLVARDGLDQYLALGPLLRDGFEQLLDKLQPEPEARSALTEDFAQLHARLERWPVAKTPIFFDAPEQRAKGSGRLLSINLNPDACKGCGLCIEVCPDGAFAWAEQTAPRIAADQANWQFQMQLPDLPDEVLDGYLSPAEPDTEVHRLLDRDVYHATVGGDVAWPGSGAKTAVHLLTAAIESVMRPRYAAHATRLSQLIDGLKQRIQGELADAMHVNDFADFAARLARLEGGEVTLDRLGQLVGDGAAARRIDPERLDRLSRLLAQLEAQRQRYGGAGRARLVLTIDPDGATLWSGTYPDNPHASPWLSHGAGDAAALAEGLIDGLTRRLADELAVCRMAELELEDASDTARAGATRERLAARAFTAEEWSLAPPLLVLSQPASARWEDTSRLLASAYPVRIAVLDPAGIGLGTDGTLEVPAASHALLALARGDACVVQATVGQPGRLLRAVSASLQRPRPALFQIHAPDAQSNGIATGQIAAQARKACASRATPLFDYDPDRQPRPLALDANPDPTCDWTTHALTFKDAYGTPTTFSAPLTVADWAIGEARFRHHFAVLAKGHLNDRMQPLAEYLALGADARSDLTPYIDVIDDTGRHCIATVSPAMAQATERGLAGWKRLRELAEGSAPRPRAAAGAAQPEVPAGPVTPAPVSDATGQAALTEHLLRLCGYSSDPAFFQKSLREFVMERNRGGEP